MAHKTSAASARFGINTRMAHFFRHPVLAGLADVLIRAGDVERATGVEQGRQRDWRRRGILPSADGGWVAYTVVQLLEIALRAHIASTTSRLDENISGGQTAITAMEGWLVVTPGMIDAPMGRRHAALSAAPPERFAWYNQGARRHDDAFVYAGTPTEAVAMYADGPVGLQLVDLRGLAMRVAAAHGGPLWVTDPNADPDDPDVAALVG